MLWKVYQLNLHQFIPNHESGSAIDALPHMHSLLNARPEGFDSTEEAIEWQSVPYSCSEELSHNINSFATNTIRNATSARVSIPSIINHDPSANLPYQWRTPLRSTAPYWLSK